MVVYERLWIQDLNNGIALLVKPMYTLWQYNFSGYRGKWYLLHLECWLASTWLRDSQFVPLIWKISSLSQSKYSEPKVKLHVVEAISISFSLNNHSTCLSRESFIDYAKTPRVISLNAVPTIEISPSFSVVPTTQNLDDEGFSLCYSCCFQT